MITGQTLFPITDRWVGLQAGMARCDGRPLVVGRQREMVTAGVKKESGYDHGHYHFLLPHRGGNEIWRPFIQAGKGGRERLRRGECGNGGREGGGVERSNESRQRHFLHVKHESRTQRCSTTFACEHALSLPPPPPPPPSLARSPLSLHFWK